MKSILCFVFVLCLFVFFYPRKQQTNKQSDKIERINRGYLSGFGGYRLSCFFLLLSFFLSGMGTGIPKVVSDKVEGINIDLLIVVGSSVRSFVRLDPIG